MSISLLVNEVKSYWNSHFHSDVRTLFRFSIHWVFGGDWFHGDKWELGELIPSSGDTTSFDVAQCSIDGSFQGLRSCKNPDSTKPGPGVVFRYSN